MKILLKRATTREEREAIFRMRYEVYVEELGIYGHKADHERRWLSDEHDEGARLIYAEVDGQMVGSTRVHAGADGPLPASYRRAYGVERFVDLLPPERMGTSTRSMVIPELRGSLVAFRLLAHSAQELIDAGTELCFCDCEPHLVSLYRGLGLRTYAPGYNSADRDLLIPMALIFGDRVYLEEIRSPLLGATRPPATPPALVAQLRARLAEADAVKPADGLSRAALWAMLHGALIGQTQASVPLLSGFTADETRLILRHGQVIECSRGDCIVHRGQAARTVFVVLEGTVSVSDGERELSERGAGDVFGEIAFLLGGRRIADVYAKSDKVKVLGLSDRTLKELTEAPGTSAVAARLLLNLSKDLALKLAHQTARSAGVDGRLEAP